MPRALILGPQRRSIVSSNPITTGAAAGRKVAISINRSRLAAARDRPREQIGKTYEAREKARRQRIVGGMQAMAVFHPTRRIDALNRDNPGVLRQIESAITSALAAAANIGHIAAHDQARRHTCSDRCSLHAP